jgi:hypothetical protein
MFGVLLCNTSSFAYARKEVCMGIDRINRKRKKEKEKSVKRVAIIKIIL